MPQSTVIDDATLADLRRASSADANLDAAAYQSGLPVDVEDNLLERRILDRIASESIDLPRLPSTAMELVRLTSNHDLDVDDVVRRIETDPSLCGEVLRSAASPLMGSRYGIGSIGDAVRRVGLRGVRSLVLGLSMRGIIFRDPDLSRYANEVWRQSATIASITRAGAPVLGVDGDRAFLIGLLSDIGKVALIELLRRELDLDPALRSAVHTGMVGEAFYRLHEVVGGRLANVWELPSDLVAIASCHHCYYKNEAEPALAALASFAHKVDFHLQAGDRGSFLELESAAEFDFIGLSARERADILRLSLSGYRATED